MKLRWDRRRQATVQEWLALSRLGAAPVFFKGAKVPDRWKREFGDRFHENRPKDRGWQVGYLPHESATIVLDADPCRRRRTPHGGTPAARPQRRRPPRGGGPRWRGRIRDSAFVAFRCHRPRRDAAAHGWSHRNPPPARVPQSDSGPPAHRP